MSVFFQNRVSRLACLVFASGVGLLQAELMYAQSFSNNTGSNHVLEDFGWFGARSRGASETNAGGSSTVVSTIEGVAAGIGSTTPESVDLNSVNPYGSNLDQGFVFMGTDGNNSTRFIFHTPASGMGDWGSAGADVGDLLSVSWAQRNQSSDARTRVAIQVGAQWYISSTSYTNPDLGAAWEAHTLSFTPESTWHTLSIQGNGSPDAANLGSSVTTSSLSGSITNMGLYAWSSSGNNVRFDNFQVVAIPEPSSLVLLGLAGFAVLIARRRT